MFSDMVGYSRMIDKDESQGIKLLEIHNELLSELIYESNGKIVKFIGDGIFSIFDSATDAIECAIIIQNKLDKRNSKEDENNHINIRVGIHIGDIVEKNKDLYGDGVNIAARIEPISLTGGIIISESVYKSTQADKKFNIRKIGSVKLKNITNPHTLFHVYKSKTDFNSESQKELNQKFINSGVNIIDNSNWVSKNIMPIAILYFDNLSDENIDYLCYGLTDDLIMDFSKVENVRIPMISQVKKLYQSNYQFSDIARELKVKYLISGSIFKSKSIVRISYHLINADNGETVIADKWQDVENNINSFRINLVSKILPKLKLQVPQHITKDLEIKSNQDSHAYELYLRGKYLIDQSKSKEDIIIARNLFEKAMQTDSSIIEANILFAMTYFRLNNFEKAKKILKNILNNHPNDLNAMSSVYNCLGTIMNKLINPIEAINFFEKALEIQKINNDKYNHVKTMNNLGNSYLRIPNPNINKARYYLNKALKLYIDHEDSRGIAIAQANIGNIENEQGNIKGAISNYQDALRKFTSENIILYQGRCYSKLANLYLKIGEFDIAENYIENSINIGNEFNDKILLGNSYFYRGLLNRKNKNPSQAIEDFEIASKLFQNRLIARVIETKIEIAISYIENEKTEVAVELLEEIVKNFQKDLFKNYMSLALSILYAVNHEYKSNLYSLQDLIDIYLNGESFKNGYRVAYYLFKSADNNKLKSAQQIANYALIEIENISENIEDEKTKKMFLDNSIEYKYFIEAKIIKKENSEIKKVYKFCPECGFKNKNLFMFCPECGSSLKL